MFGGRVSAYETLVDRARREAILRMKEEAKGADIILNMRLETSSISKGREKTLLARLRRWRMGRPLPIHPVLREPLRLKSHSPGCLRKRRWPLTPLPPERRYKVVFSGEIAAGQDLQRVKNQVAKLYKVPVERCEHLFSGRTVTIKDNLDYQTAQKYQRIFERTGAVCSIEPM